MKKYIILLILIFLLLLIVTILSDSDSSNNNLNPSNSFEYGEKMSFIKKNDGWYYYLYTNSNNEFFFDGCNLKYNELEGYYVNLYKDEDKDEIIDKFVTFPSLSTSDHSSSKNKILERDEVILINDYFNKKQFNHNISEKDLKELKIENFNKEDLIILYNDLISKDMSSTLTEYKLYECDYRYDDFQDGYKVFVGFLVQRSGIAKIEIDLIYKNNKYLSDKINDNTASQDEKEIYEYLQQIEKEIEETQNIDINREGKAKYILLDNRITNLLKTIERVEINDWT